MFEASCPGTRPPPRPKGRSGMTAIATTALHLLVPLAVLPGLARALFFAQQNITDRESSYCGFYELQRYKAWCVNASVNAFVASNATCQQYGVCIPLAAAESMSCTNSTYCSGWRRDLDEKDYKAEAACLSVKAAVNGTVAVCDLEIEGPSIFDSPPPAPAPPPPVVEKKKRDWALWKTMTIIWSILGFAAFVVITVLLVRWWMRRRAQSPTSSPVTILSDEEKQRIDQGGQPPVQPNGQVQMAPGGPVDMTAMIRQTSPDGKPLLGYGSSYPAPPPFGGTALPANGSQLAPNASDALLQAALSSRNAYNSPPMHAAPLGPPPQFGLPAGSALNPQIGGMPAGYAGQPSGIAGGVLGGGIPPVVMPAASVPLTAATLQNPGGSPEAGIAQQPYH